MFDLGAYLDAADIDLRLLELPAGRRAVTELDPLLFGLLYLPKTVKLKGLGWTFSEFHIAVFGHARRWAIPVRESRSQRDAYVASRDSGKSTLFHKVLPLWAAAHGHVQYMTSFSASDDTVAKHLRSFRKELRDNALLRMDFPELCTPAKRDDGAAESDNRNSYIARSGFKFEARGLTSAVLGAKEGDLRPDLILIDDAEPDEGQYSADQKDKRLGTLIDSILYLNEWARVVLVGTVTMEGSIVHDLVRSVTEPDTAEPWIEEQNFRCHYFPALITDEESGEQRSVWPEKWPLELLLSRQHTRDFKKNFQNDPLGRDGQYWLDTDFAYGELPEMSGQLLSIDPAITSKARSDETALAVIGAQREKRDGKRVIEPTKACVLYAEARRIQVGEPLRQWVISVLTMFPNILRVLIEVNQGGDTWLEILHDIGVPIDVVSNSLPKEVRASRLLARYQTDRVLHAKRFPKAEGQMVGFPKVPHDDLVDAIGNGVNVYLKQNNTAPREPGRTESYV